MAFDIFKHGHRDSAPEEDDPARTRTPEEEALLAKAREEVAEREEERRGHAGDVGDFLGDMLDATAPPRAEEKFDGDALPQGPGSEDPPGVPPEPSVDVELGGEEAASPEERSPAGSEASSPFAALADRSEEPPPIRRPTAVRLDPVEATPREGPGGRELSPLMRKVMRDLQALGSVAGDRDLAYEPESASEDAERTMEMLAQGHRRRSVGVDFEPANAAREPDLEKAQAPTAVMQRPPEGREDGPTRAAGADGPTAGEKDDWLASREYSLEDLPDSGPAPALTGEDEEPGVPAADDALQEGHLGGAEILDSSDDDEAPPTGGNGVPGAPPEEDKGYGLDDLPPVPVDSGELQDEDASPVEPAMEESTLDDRGLDAALAAADEVVPGDAASADSAAEAEAASESESVVGGRAPVSDAKTGEDPAGAGGSDLTAEAPGKYGLDDLPAVPQEDDMMAPSDDRNGSAGAGDLMPDQSLPELTPPTMVTGDTPQTDPGVFTGVERALDGQVEPSIEGPAAAGPAAPAGPEAIPDISGAEHAADLSVDQLAEVEKLIEKEVELEELRSIAAREEAPPPEPRLGFLMRWVGKASTAVAAAFVMTRDTVDRRLAPYSLSCKILLGIAGILLLAVVGALSLKTWILPAWSQPAG